MQPQIPEYLDLIQKAELGCEVEGEWPVAGMDRLVDMLADSSGLVQAHMQLGREGRLRYITGDVSASVQVTCQRCMQPMALHLQAELKLGLVMNETQAERLPEGFEPLLLEEGKTRIPELLEDELILAMPLVAMHEHDCSEYLQQQQQRQTEDADQAEAEKAQQNPFSVLKDLL